MGQAGDWLDLGAQLRADLAAGLDVAGTVEQTDFGMDYRHWMGRVNPTLGRYR